MDGSYVKMGRSSGEHHKVHVDHNTPIIECDHTATNGIVHVIDHVMPSATHKYFRHRWTGREQHRNRVAQTVDNMMEGLHSIAANQRVQSGVHQATEVVRSGMEHARDTWADINEHVNSHLTGLFGRHRNKK